MSLDRLIAEARGVIATALREPSASCVTSSFQHDCVVLLHLVTAEMPDIPVLFLDTDYHFRETIEYRDRMACDWNLNLRVLKAPQPVTPRLYETDPDGCCHLRKVEPLFAGLAAYDTWFTALRREQSPTRANLEIHDKFKLPSGKTLQKISPLAEWTNRDVWQYIERFAIPVLPLYQRGYTSIGCEPCTSLPVSADDLRSGRWQGKKLECGIHLQAK
ncbi:MAG TPA: phosphoadenylyl-sulfate reductase [Bryobacteraceae bacterium]|nr:phosphoadenylyl-sulfate reductase [Bryobacteraceae bacterium]